MMGPTSALPAIPIQELMPMLRVWCVTDREGRLLEKDEIFINAEFRNQQICRLKEFIETECGRILSNGDLCRGFNAASATVSEALRRGFARPKERGRPPSLDDDKEKAILQWIEKNADQSRPVTRTDILHYVHGRLNEMVTRGWVDNFLTRRKIELFETLSSPQENPRLQVPREYLDTTIRCIQDHVTGAQAELVFNLDEVGISEWEDRKPRFVVVPMKYKGIRIHHGQSRNLKHLSVVACVSAAGEHMTPYIVTSQDSEPVRTALKKSGIRMGVDLILKYRKKPYMSSELFLDYVKTVLVPYIEELRENEEFAGKEAILMMDNCSCHTNDDVIQFLTQHGVKVITFAPHTTQIFQMLDLSLFGIFKRRQQYHLPLDEANQIAEFIQKVFHNFKQTMVEDNIRGAFTMTGFSFNINTEPYTLAFEEEKLRQSGGFREIWDLNFPLENMSARRRRSKFGWINEEEWSQLG
jgi:hypothetical protein